MKTLNINCNVRIKLNPCGIKRLRQKHEERRSIDSSIGEFIPPKVDKDGYCEMQLWRIMQIFGEDLYFGNNNPPFECNIQIDDSNFRNV